MEIIAQSNIKRATEILKNKGIIAFPTETVFGFGVIFNDEKAYQRLIQVKRRPPEKPFTLMCADIEEIYQYAEVTEEAEKLLKAFMPGQFTIILKAKASLPKWCVSSDGNVGIRIPDYEMIRGMIREVGAPILVPSANRSGEPPICDSDLIIPEFSQEIDGLIEGKSTSKTPSSVVILNPKLMVIREGLITKEMIDKVLEEN